MVGATKKMNSNRESKPWPADIGEVVLEAHTKQLRRLVHIAERGRSCGRLHACVDCRHVKHCKAGQLSALREGGAACGGDVVPADISKRWRSIQRDCVTWSVLVAPDSMPQIDDRVWPEDYCREPKRIVELRYRKRLRRSVSTGGVSKCTTE